MSISDPSWEARAAELLTAELGEPGDEFDGAVRAFLALARYAENLGVNRA